MKKIILFTFLAIIGGSLRAQLLTVRETSKNATDTLSFKDVPIVDINGSLSVQIKKGDLLLKIPQVAQSDPQRTARLKALLFILQSEQELLRQLSIPAAMGKPDLVQLKSFSTLMIEFLGRVQQYPSIRQDVNKLAIEFGAKYRDNSLDKSAFPNAQTYVIKNLSKITDTLITGLQSSAGASNVSIQLKAFLNTKKENAIKVHVENFDNYSAGEYYEVPRWVTSFSQSDIQQYNQMADVSATLNTMLNSKLSDIVKGLADSVKSYQCFNELLTSVQTQAATISGQANADVSTFVQTSEQNLKDLVSALQAIKNPGNVTGLNGLQVFNQTVNNLLTVASNFKASVTALRQQVNQQVINADPALRSINSQFDNCTQLLQKDIQTATAVYNTVTGLFKPFQNTASQVQQVTGAAFDLTINKLPEFGYIDLKTTGQRENGDELEIKLIYRTSDDIAQNKPGTTLRLVDIELQQINFYSETNIGVILARPFNNSADVKLSRQFQFAPAGSLLLKFGSRKSRLWNSLSPGIGFNVSTPDFNLDGSPDVSYGGVITLFRNVLSAGLSYNTKTSSPFWFFGLSLPFATLGLPIGNVQTTK
ncbi:hypothetical protein MUY27_01185 [Mucilaginibacter sp. RS28]|uniref:Uncharacterized protein n=1 Tax=Mucilaginibacter straminoryzae TaxID=2932774 RepID=A0A9X1X020_9SPHI|nr:hypothetical protein [Mucilaginibacter straminoryzae]MCJ8208301.1 hypothetical protein [Mucilaginibacter straminoryzae]